MITKFENHEMYPRIDQSLRELDIDFNSQLRMPLYGICDFVVRDERGCRIALECKRKMSGIKDTIAQVWLYCVQYRPFLLPALVVIEDFADDSSIDLCKCYGVEVITVPFNGSWTKQLSIVKEWLQEEEGQKP